MLNEYYSKLVDTLTASDLSHYFVSDRVISLADHEEITKPTTPSHEAVCLLLSKILIPLQEEGDVGPLIKMLGVMENYGNRASKALSLEIRASMFGDEKCCQGSVYIQYYLHKFYCVLFGLGSLSQHLVNHEHGSLTDNRLGM